MLGFGSKDHPAMKDVPIGLDATGTREEFDSMGTVEVPADKYYGAQTARSLVHFSIGGDRMPKAVYHAYGVVKKACALVNQAEGACRTGRRRPSCAPPTRRSGVSSTRTTRSSCGRRARARRAT